MTAIGVSRRCNSQAARHADGETWGSDKLPTSENAARVGGAWLFLEDGAGFGDVGVKGLDHVAIFFFDDAALEF